MSLDLAHHEILVASLSSRALAVFPWDAKWNVAPVRYISGPKTKLGHVVGLGVDSVTDLLAVANSEEILIFNRTDNGDVEPVGEIAGPHTGIGDEPWELQIYKS